jgi:inosine-uridine nucleoside N-ribohydrolase
MILELAMCGLMALGVIDEEKPVPPAPVKLIYDTDLGNDVDDALALGVIHALQDRGECELLAVTITKDHPQSAPYVDAVNTYYGRPDIPIGNVKDGVTKQDSRYTGVIEHKDGDTLRYPHDLKSGDDTPSATTLLREVLAAQPDGSVVIAQVGFSTNLARLLDSKPDNISPLNGRDLAAKKVKFISVMAGAFKPFNGKPHPEYNVVKDIPSAQRLTKDWPTPIIYSGFEIGIETALYQDAMKFDFRYQKDHILDVSYHHYHSQYRDQPSWDLTSVLYAVRPDRGYFDLSKTGYVHYDDEGYTYYREHADGKHQYLIADEGQAERVKEALALLACQPPQK